MRPKPFIPEFLDQPCYVKDKNSGLIWHRCELRTLYVDTDRSQVVYHANYLKYFEIFGIEKYVMRFSTHAKEGLGKKYIDNEALWIKTEDMVRRAMQNGGVRYVEVEDEAAFYGPKLDFMVKDALGRQWQLGTIQVDYNLPERFDLTYKGSDNELHRPVMIHRAPFGSMERFIAILLEHTGGNFPLWLAPKQVIILPVSDKFNDYAYNISESLKAHGVRVDVDSRSEKIGSKIRDAEMQKINIMVIVGEKEVEGNLRVLRRRRS